LKPFFSIIIPLLNSGKTLQKTLDSIAAQDYKDIELIFIDGGSTDDTPAIIHNFETVSTIPVYLTVGPDNGIYDAMNKGMELAAGQWFYFMGGDDRFFSATVLQDVHDTIKDTPTDLIYGNVVGADSGVVYADDTPNKVLSRGIHHQSIFYKRSLFSYTGKYDLRFKIAADYHLTLKLFCTDGLHILYADRTIAIYGETGLSSTSYDYHFFSYHYKFLAKKNALARVDDPEKILSGSIYCCLQLARIKKHLLFAWQNLFFYVMHTRMPFGRRVRTIGQMLYWNIKP